MSKKALFGFASALKKEGLYRPLWLVFGWAGSKLNKGKVNFSVRGRSDERGRSREVEPTIQRGRI